MFGFLKKLLYVYHMNNLKQILESQGRSKEWLSKQLDVSWQTVYNWCKNKAQPNGKYCLIICELLNIELKELVK